MSKRGGQRSSVEDGENKKERKNFFFTSAGSSTSITLPSLSVAVSLTKGKEEAGGNPPWSPMTEAASAAPAEAWAAEEDGAFLLLLGDSALSAAALAVTSSRKPAMRLALPSVENMASKSSGRRGMVGAPSSP